MQRITELKNELGERYYELYYNSEKNYLYANWIGFAVTSAEIVKGAEQLMKWLEENPDKHCASYINDNREFKGTWGEAREWINEVWTPSVYSNGLRFCALILSDDIFAQMAARSFEEASAEIGKIDSRSFKSFIDAEKWVLAKNQVAS
jgi:hypothetical protein